MRSDAEVSDVPARRPPAIRRWMQGFLALQVALAGLLLLTDITDRRPFAESPPTRPVITDPFRPGDQVRPFRPGWLPQRPDAPAHGPLLLPDDMDRLAFEVIDHATLGTTLRVQGPIAFGDRHRFALALDEAAAPVRAVTLHSPGGAVGDAIAIGELVREKALKTTVPAEAACVSACPWILAGGIERVISRQAWVGMHQMYHVDGVTLSPAAAVADIQAAQAAAIAVLVRLGIDARITIPAMATPPNEMYFLIEDELIDYRLATQMID